MGVISGRAIDRFIRLARRGFSYGIKDAKRDQMCVEYALNCAMLNGADGDDLPCVDPALRAYIITLNDTYVWDGALDRAKALAMVGVLQLGTRDMHIDLPRAAWVGSRLARLSKVHRLEKALRKARTPGALWLKQHPEFEAKIRRFQGENAAPR